MKRPRETSPSSVCEGHQHALHAANDAAGKQASSSNKPPEPAEPAEPAEPRPRGIAWANQLCKARSPDPNGYVDVPATRLVLVFRKLVCDDVALMDGLDLFRRVYGADTLMPILKIQPEILCDRVKYRYLDRDNPFFLIIICLQLAAKWYSQFRKLSVGACSTWFGFSWSKREVWRAETSLLEMVNYMPFKMTPPSENAIAMES